MNNKYYLNQSLPIMATACKKASTLNDGGEEV